MTPNLYFNNNNNSDRTSGSNYYYPSKPYGDQYPRYGSGYADLFDINKQVKELDRQLAIVRSSPPKIHYSGKEVTVQMDMSRFVPQEIEITVAGTAMIVKAMATVYLNEKNSVDKIFKRKFTFPSSILHDSVTTTIDRYYMVTIKAKRI